MTPRYPALGKPAEGYVFIVTYGRSGSTLLQNLLNAIEGYCIRGENANALFHLMQSWHAIETAPPIRGMRKSQAPSAGDHPWYGAEMIRAEHYGRALANFFVREVLKPGEGVRVCGFKEIRFHAHPKMFLPYLNFIHRFFPAARFVFNTRDHAAVARSGWWADMDPDTVKAQLVAAEDLFERFRALRPDCTIRLHYDDYVADRSRLSALFDFLGEPFDRATVDRILDHRLTHLKLQDQPPPGS